MKIHMPQDIVPARRSIKDISVKRQSTQSVQNTPSEREYNFDYDIDQPKKKSRVGLFSLIIVFILALVFGVMTFFSSAHVTVIPKTDTIPVDVTLSALKDQASGQFGYQIVSVSATADKKVAATGSEQVTTKASGSIIVYNISTTVQKLVASTRFQTVNGLVYRASSAVSVPKASIVNGKSVPGNIVVSVLADQVGEAYNIGLSDFTLPGFKGTPQAKNIYGRSQTIMTGGFNGIRKKVSDDIVNQTSSELDKSLRATLQSNIVSQLPSNFILYPQSVSYDIGSVTQKTGSSEDSNATLTKTATAQAIIFDRTLLSKALLQALAGPDSPSDAHITNLDTLSFILKVPLVLNKSYGGQISFGLKGDIHTVWNFDAASLKSDLLGLKKSNLGALLQAKYASIESASASIFPIWKQSFPSDPNKVTVTSSI